MPRRSLSHRGRASMRLRRHLAARRTVFVRVHEATPVRFARRLQLVVGGDEGSARWRDAFMAWPELAAENVEPLPVDVPQLLGGPELEANLPADWTQPRGADAQPVAAASDAPPAPRPVRRFVPAVAQTSPAAPPIGSRPLESRPARITAPASRRTVAQQDRIVPAPDTTAADSVAAPAPAVATSAAALPADIADPAAPLLEALLSVAERPTATPRSAPIEAPPAPATRPHDQVVATAEARGVVAAPPSAARPEQPEVDGGDGESGDAPRLTPVIDEPRAILPSVVDDRSAVPARVPVFVAPIAPNDGPMPPESVSDTAPPEPTRRAVPARAVPHTQNAPTFADAVDESSEVAGEPEESEGVADLRATPSPAPEESAPVAAEAQLAAPNEPVARASRRSRVEELPAESLPPRRDSDPPSAKRAEPTAAGRAASGARKSPDDERETSPADQLFRPIDDGVDRTPAALGARLFAAFAPPRRAPSAAPPPPRSTPPAAAPRTQEPRAATDPQSRRVAAVPSRHAVVPARPNVRPVPTPPDTARILTPLVGIDPSTVTVLQGPDATAATAAARADALAIGSDTVVVGPTFTGSSPRDVGLLAHELTHVARAREPRFVPPIARPLPPRGVNYQGEEDVARRVEGRVATVMNGSSPPRVVAEAQRLQPTAAAVPPEPHAFEPPHAGADGPRALPAEQEGDQWGGLPAPWEPLPQWLASSPSASREGTAPFLSSDAPGVMTQAPMVSSWGSAAPSPVVHAADESRTVDAPAPAQAAAPAPAPGDEAGESGPDLDWLARQVYSALKRRLGAEARRENLF